MSTKQGPTSGRLPGAGSGKSKQSAQSEAWINARSSTVWEVVTDARNYTVWESGITHITGELRDGGTIRVRTGTGGDRTYRLRVQQIPGAMMTWTGGLPLGLLTRVRTFTLERRRGMTHLRVKDEFTGPLRRLLREAVSDNQALIDYVHAVRNRAEIIDRHVRPTVA